MKTINYLSAAMIALATTVGSPVYAEKPEEMNLRQHMDPRLRNKLSNARLKGMLAGEKAKSQIAESFPGDQDTKCSTQIGNLALGNSGQSNSQDIIILGDVINYCNR